MVSGEKQRPGRPETVEDFKLYEEFQQLSFQWREETMGYAFLSRRLHHPAYQRIVEMGSQVVPWMLWDLQEGKGEWYPALRTITGENPIAEEDRGYRKKMNAAWVALGRERGWID